MIDNSTFPGIPSRLFRAIWIWTIIYSASLFTGVFLAQLTSVVGFVLGVTVFYRGWTSRPASHPAFYPFVLTVVVFLLSSLVNSGQLASIRFVFKHYGIPVLGFAGALLLMRSRTLRTKAFDTIAIAGALSGIYGIFQHFTGLDPLYGQKLDPISVYHMKSYLAVGLLDMALTFAGVQLTALLFVLPAAWSAKGKRAWWLWGSVGIMFLSIFLILRRGPLMAAVIMAGLFLITRNRRVAAVTIVAGILAASAAWFASPAVRQSVEQVLEVKGVSVGQRVVLWDAAAKMGADHPLLGVGPGRWRVHLGEYIEDTTSRGGRSFAHAHSDPMSLWATTGFLGLVSVSLIQIALILTGLRDLHRRRQRGEDRDIYLGGMLANAGLLIAAFSQCYMLDAENMLALAAVLAMMLGARENLLAARSSDLDNG